MSQSRWQGTLLAQALEQMVQGVAAVLNPVCRPVAVPLIVFLPYGRQIPDVLRFVPVAQAGGGILCRHARQRGGEVRRRICGQSVSVTVLPLNGTGQTVPVRAGDPCFWIGILGRSGKRFIDEVRRHGGAQTESGLV